MDPFVPSAGLGRRERRLMTDPGPPTPPETHRPTPSGPVPCTLVALDPRSVWRAGLVVIGLVVLYSLGSFVLDDGGSMIFQVTMAWLASIAMEPAVPAGEAHAARPRHRPGHARVVLFAVAFSAAFGNLLISQAVTLIQAIPTVLTAVATWVNQTFGTSFDPATLLGQLHVSPQTLAGVGRRRSGRRPGRPRHDPRRLLLPVHPGAVHLLLLRGRPPPQALGGTAAAPTASGGLPRRLGWRSRRPAATSPPAWSSPRSAAGSPRLPVHHRDALLAGPRGVDRLRAEFVPLSAPTSPSRCRWSSG